MLKQDSLAITAMLSENKEKKMSEKNALMITIDNPSDYLHTEITDNGNVMHILGRIFFHPAAKPKAWCTWFLEEESKDLYEMCRKLKAKSVPFELTCC